MTEKDFNPRHEQYYGRAEKAQAAHLYQAGVVYTADPVFLSGIIRGPLFPVQDIIVDRIDTSQGRFFISKHVQSKNYLLHLFTYLFITITSTAVALW